MDPLYPLTAAVAIVAWEAFWYLHATYLATRRRWCGPCNHPLTRKGRCRNCDRVYPARSQ